MEWKARPEQRADEWEIRRLALLYARAMDRNEPAILEQIFTEDGVIDRQGNRREGRAAILKVPPYLRERYLATMHKVHNQLVTVSGPDSAEGETYCTAEHLQRDIGGGTTLFSMSIRYQDTIVRQGGAWRFKLRRLIIEWTDIRQIHWSNAPPASGA
jgi:hypothetical protein